MVPRLVSRRRINRCRVCVACFMSATVADHLSVRRFLRTLTDGNHCVPDTANRTVTGWGVVDSLLSPPRAQWFISLRALLRSTWLATDLQVSPMWGSKLSLASCRHVVQVYVYAGYNPVATVTYMPEMSLVTTLKHCLSHMLPTFHVHAQVRINLSIMVFVALFSLTIPLNNATHCKK